MPKYIVDANLPYYFSLWRDEAYVHIIDINPQMKDSEIWQYAKQYNVTIITKDADFSHWVLFNHPPLRVIHIRLGNMKIKTLHQTLANIWDNVLQMSENHKLIRIYSDAIEAID